jgi:hypothetical protein
MLQARRSKGLIPDEVIIFFSWLILPATLWSYGQHSL